MTKKMIMERAEYARSKGFSEIADEIIEMCKTHTAEEIIRTDAYKIITRIFYH